MTVIVYGVLWTGLVTLRRQVEKGQLTIKNILMIFQMILFLELGLFILSVFRRIYLYQKVVSQPEDEQGFERDVSFDSPFFD